MNKDNSLKTSEQKLILLIVGNDGIGKKTLVRQWANKYNFDSEENRTFYKIINFYYNGTIGEDKINLLIEIRIINGDEIDTDLKVNASFFKGALGAFVITSIEDFMSFQDGIKWKEKLDLMCCLPNRFPIPVNLIINRCDKIQGEERRPWIDKIPFDNYVKENQFFNYFFVSSEYKRETNRESLLSNKSVEVESPLIEIIRSIFKFKDIREKFINQSSLIEKLISSKTNIKEIKDVNSSESSTKSSRAINIKNGSKKDGNCFIL